MQMEFEFEYVNLQSFLNILSKISKYIYKIFWL